MRKIVAALIPFIMIVSAIVVTADDEKSITIHLTFEKPKEMKYGNGSLFYIHGCKLDGDAGSPIMPVKPLQILLPQNKKIDRIIAKNVDIVRASYPKRLDNGNAATGKSDKGAIVEYVGTYYFRGFRIAVIKVHPIMYENRSAYYYEHIDITLRLKDAKPNPLYRGLKEDIESVKKMVYNPEYVATYENKNCALAGEEHRYVIITSKKLANDFGENTFKKFVEFKNKFGMNATIVTIEDIISNPAYWNKTAMFNDTQAKIRNFIRWAYINWHTDYVLLGGDVDIVPVRYLNAEGEFHIEYSIPSDVYYSCLDGSYNGDKDNKWGEPNDGEDGKDVDLYAEVYVGRASIDTYDEEENFVMKTIAYESNYDDYVKNVLLAGEDLGWGGNARWGGNHLDQFIDTCTDGNYTTHGIPSSRFNIIKLYDRDRTTPWSKQDIMKIMDDGVHLIAHMGHANYVYNMRMVTDDVLQLTNDKYFFAYSSGCMSGGFDQDDCIAEYFTVKTQHGAFAGIWNTRYGWGGGQDEPYDIIDYGTQRFAREFWDAIFGEGIRELGKANADSKEDNVWRINDLVMRFCYYELTLFGDPSAVLKDVDEHPPSKPSKPSGTEDGKIKQEYTYTSMAQDDDGDMIYYIWDFGDGSTYIIGPYEPGKSVEVTHSWARKGKYEVKVKAVDIYGRESEWSDSLLVSMPYTYHPLMELMIQIIQDILHIVSSPLSSISMPISFNFALISSASA